MSKRVRWGILILFLVAVIASFSIYAYVNRTKHCFDVDPDTWNLACADHAETLAQQGDEPAMGALATAYFNLNNQERSYYWRRKLAERGNLYAIDSSAYLCGKHSSVSRSNVLELIDRYIGDDSKKVEIRKKLDKACPA